MKLIVGLGNPGPQYALTRHNIGWLVVDSFVKRLSLSTPQMKFNGYFWGPCLIDGQRVSFLKPKTFMNLSGESVLMAASFMNLSTENILVIYDDSSIPWGRLRLKKSGSSGGQKGMKSILESFNTTEISRLRIGIGSPPNKLSLTDWVLGKIPLQQRKNIDKLEEISFEALLLWISEDINVAMSRINGLNFEPEGA